MNIADWFNPMDLNHIQAYRHLERHGHWPEGFLPDGIEMSSVWQVDLIARMSECWIQHMLGERDV